MNDLQTLARELRPPIERLDALLVPLSTSFKDSEGKLVLHRDEARRRLVECLNDAWSAVRDAREALGVL